jgi:hypothetical protein
MASPGLRRVLSLFLIVLIASLFDVGALRAPIAQAQSSSPGEEVDVALVLAVDISYSMDPDELTLQRQGYVEALRSPQFHEALRKGLTGKIALTYMEWAGSNTQHVLIPWTVIDGAEVAMEVASKIDNTRINRAYRTSIASAIDKAVELLDNSGVKPLRKVIDISGDGPNNQGRSVTTARDDAIAKGITINGLPILLKRPGYLDIDNLDIYYEDCVIGGPNSFMVTIREREQFATAIRSKLLMEVASIAPGPFDGAKVQMAQANPQRQPRVSCAVGERQWRDRNAN